jgi:hypothetical protein
LQSQSHTIIAGNLLQSYLQMALLAVACIIMMVLTGIHGKKENLSSPKHLLN